MKPWRLPARARALWAVGATLWALFAWLPANADSLSGRYTDAADSALSMRLSEAPNGAITGTLSEPGMSMPVKAKRNATGFAGTVGPMGNALPISAKARGNQFVLQIGAQDEAERITLIRTDSSPSPGTGNTANAPSGKTPPPGTRNVVINEKRLSSQELGQIERAYRVRIDDANYWYDPVLGAWGLKGGPTMGFISPGLKLGGPLRPDASGRGTYIFVNGRELHLQDVLALQRITGPIQPGRYFISAQGLAGFEGGPPLWNLHAMARNSGGSGGSGTWNSRLSSGFSDGTTGAVFLPNGGIVSTGQ